MHAKVKSKGKLHQKLQQHARQDNDAGPCWRDGRVVQWSGTEWILREKVRGLQPIGLLSNHPSCQELLSQYCGI